MEVAMDIAVGYIEIFLFVVAGFLISQRVALLWDKWVISRTRVLTEEDGD